VTPIIRPAGARGKPEYHPFPAGWPPGWLAKFRAALEHDPAAERLRKHFIPACSFVQVGVWAITYARNSHSFARDRKRRLKELEADLRKEDRRLTAEVNAFNVPEVFTPATIQRFFGSDEFRMLCAQEAKRQHLESVRVKLANMPRAANVKRLGRENLTWLVLIREYLGWKSRKELKATDLAAIVRAAHIAIGAPLPDDEIAGDGLLRRLRRFEQNCPEFCQAVHARFPVVKSFGTAHPQNTSKNN